MTMLTSRPFKWPAPLLPRNGRKPPHAAEAITRYPIRPNVWPLRPDCWGGFFVVGRAPYLEGWAQTTGLYSGSMAERARAAAVWGGGLRRPRPIVMFDSKVSFFVTKPEPIRRGRMAAVDGRHVGDAEINQGSITIGGDDDILFGC
jgi:hypothetical protein